MNYRNDWEQFSREFRVHIILYVPYGWDETYDWHNALLMGGEMG